MTLTTTDNSTSVNPDALLTIMEEAAYMAARDVQMDTPKSRLSYMAGYVKSTDTNGRIVKLLQLIIKGET